MYFPKKICNLKMFPKKFIRSNIFIVWPGFGLQSKFNPTHKIQLEYYNKKDIYEKKITAMYYNIFIKYNIHIIIFS